MPDFFIPDVDYQSIRSDSKREKSRQSIKNSENSDIYSTLSGIQKYINEEIVNSTKSIFQFDVNGK
jgi:hypothetical protein